MAANHKLTNLIAGRVIAGTANADGKLTINFSDDSHMSVKTAGNTNSAATGGTVAKVRQDSNNLYLDMEGGATLTIPTTEATSSVMVRDKTNRMEYAD